MTEYNKEIRIQGADVPPYYYEEELHQYYNRLGVDRRRAACERDGMPPLSPSDIELMTDRVEAAFAGSIRPSRVGFAEEIGHDIVFIFDGKPPDRNLKLVAEAVMQATGCKAVDIKQEGLSTRVTVHRGPS